MKDLVTVVIRSVGERTEAACRNATLAQGLPEENVVIIREAPFSRAMRVGFEAGIAAGRPWVFCVDADVILRPGSVAAMLAHACRQPENVFEVQGLALDKLFMCLREVGNHLFRSALLPGMISCIPEEGSAVRPEGEAMRRMAARGYPWQRVPYVVGVHDFWQYNRDIFRKCFTHSHKHLHLLPDLVLMMRSRAERDRDFAIAIEGLAEGLRAIGKVQIDVCHRAFSERFAALGLEEKEPAAPDELTADIAEAVLHEWAALPEVKVRGLPVNAVEAVAMDGMTRFTRVDRFAGYIRQRRGQIGTMRLLPYAAGSFLEQMGRRLKSTAGVGQ